MRHTKFLIAYPQRNLYYNKCTFITKHRCMFIIIKDKKVQTLCYLTLRTYDILRLFNWQKKYICLSQNITYNSSSNSLLLYKAIVLNFHFGIANQRKNRYMWINIAGISYNELVYKENSVLMGKLWTNGL